MKMINGESNSEKIAFWDEPGEHLLVFSKLQEDKIDVAILSSDCEGETEASALTLNERRVIYADKDTLANFASVVCTGIDSLLGRHSLQQYEEQWCRCPFPIEIYGQLKEALRT